MVERTVAVIGADRLVEKMFFDAGWFCVGDGWQYSDGVDLICFTGGEDVSPHLYGEENIASHCNEARDVFEQEVYEEFVGKVPMVGICRGGQLLNVLNGGKMIQHIEGHHMGHHKLHFFLEGAGSYVRINDVHGDHHQGMVASDRRFVQAIADDDNQEVIYYPKTKSLCFQPHPEWGHEGTRELFFDLLGEYLDV